MKIRVFELAKAKGVSIAQAVDLLARKGVAGATAITYVEPNILDDVPDLPPAESRPAASQTPDEAAAAREALLRQRSSAIAAGLSRKATEEYSAYRPPERDNSLALVATGISVIALVFVGYLFFSERSDRSEIRELSAELGLVKSGNAKIEDIVINNRAQILDLKDEVSGMEKRLYEFKRASLVTQLKSQGVVIRALADSLKEPLKGKAQTLSNHLSTF
ncbi:MAG: hypothetical protein HZA04_06585 [Nitrospinae bacterium]|nr:hypothetical protein [Nitrospinota bacterium]